MLSFASLLAPWRRPLAALSLVALLFGVSACSESVEQGEATTPEFDISMPEDRIAAYGQQIYLDASATSANVDIVSWQWSYLGVLDLQVFAADEPVSWFNAPSDDIELDFELEVCDFNSNCASAQTTVSVSDVPIATLSAPVTEVSEPDDVLVVDITLNDFSPVPITLSFAYSGTAELGTDFSAPEQALVAADSLYGALTIAVIDDDLDASAVEGQALLVGSEQSSWSNDAFTFTIASEDVTPVVTSSPLYVAYTGELETDYAITGSDADGDTLTFSIEGGDDGDLFSVNPSTGILSFNSEPQLEPAQDADGDNVFELMIGASDGYNLGTAALSINLIQAIDVVNLSTATNPEATTSPAISSTSSNAEASWLDADLRVFTLSPTQAYASWQPNPGAVWYALYRRPCPERDCQQGAWSLLAQSLEAYHQHSVAQGQLYQYEVRAYAKSGDYSASARAEYYAPLAPLNDSGVTQARGGVSCAAAPNQSDCKQGLDSLYQSYPAPLKLGHGAAAFDLATHQACPLDHRTGLSWQPQAYALGGLYQTADQLVATSNASALCGYSDWRLPTLSELLSLADFEANAWAGSWLTEIPGITRYLAADATADGRRYALEHGNLYHQLPAVADGAELAALLVRSPPEQALATGAQRYWLRADGHALDLSTGLHWQRCPYPQQYQGNGACSGDPLALDWQQALAAADNSSERKWRIPNIKELISLLQASSGGMETTTFPGGDGRPLPYWSSTPKGAQIWGWHPTTGAQLLDSNSSGLLLLVQ